MLLCFDFCSWLFTIFLLIHSVTVEEEKSRGTSAPAAGGEGGTSPVVITIGDGDSDAEESITPNSSNKSMFWDALQGRQKWKLSIYMTKTFCVYWGMVLTTFFYRNSFWFSCMALGLHVCQCKSAPRIIFLMTNFKLPYTQKVFIAINFHHFLLLEVASFKSS